MLVYFFCIYRRSSLHIMLNVSHDILKFCFHQLVPSFSARTWRNICLALGIHHALRCILPQLVLSSCIIIFICKYLNSIQYLISTILTVIFFRCKVSTVPFVSFKLQNIKLLSVRIPSVVLHALSYKAFTFCCKISRLVQTLISINSPSLLLN